MAAPGAPEARALGRCHRNYAETLWQYLRSIPGATRRDLPDATLVRCDLPSSVTNVLFIPKLASAARERLLQARAFFGPKLPWRVIVSGAGAAEVGSAAVDLGLRPAPNEPGMLLDPIPSIPAMPDSLTIQPVTNAQRLAAFGAVWCEAFRFPDWVLPVALPRAPSDDPEHGVQNRFFVGYVDGRPVSCASVTVTERVAGIASVGIVRSARKRGFGTAMTWAAIDAGRALGAEVSYLAATPMGYRVYERMGFRRAAEYPSWYVPLGFFASLGALRTVRRLVRQQQSRQPDPGPARRGP